MNTTKTDTSTRVAALEAEMAAVRVTNLYVQKTVRELRDDAKFLRRTVITTMVSLISAVVLMILGVLFQKLST